MCFSRIRRLVPKVNLHRLSSFGLEANLVLILKQSTYQCSYACCFFRFLQCWSGEASYNASVHLKVQGRFQHFSYWSVSNRHPYFEASPSREQSAGSIFLVSPCSRCLDPPFLLRGWKMNPTHRSHWACSSAWELPSQMCMSVYLRHHLVCHKSLLMNGALIPCKFWRRFLCQRP